MSETDYQDFMRASVAEIKAEQQRMNETMILMRIDIATLKVKAGMWGGGGALIVGLAAFVAQQAGAL